MTDPGRLLRTPKNVIVILRPLILPSESSGLQSCQICANRKEMADIIVRAQQIRIKIRLKMRLKKRSSLTVHLIFICINRIHVRIFFQKRRHLIECIRFQKIIMIQKGCKIPGSHFKSRIGIPAIPLFSSRFLTLIRPSFF